MHEEFCPNCGEEIDEALVDWRLLATHPSTPWCPGWPLSADPHHMLGQSTAGN